MKKLFQIIGFQRKKGNFGIEIEVEGENMVPLLNSEYWNVENDGSLRGAFPAGSSEYVLKGPLDINKCELALQELSDHLRKFKLNFSFRTSVHVHLNVQDLTEKQLLALIYTYYLLEEPLVNYCGKERKGNRFCLRLQDAEGILDFVQELAREGVKSIFGIPQDKLRYAGLNLASIAKYGSLEFRSMKGNIDVNYIMNWLRAIQKLEKFALKIGDAVDVYNHFIDREPVQFLSDVLEEVHELFLYKNVERDIRRSFSLSIDIPFMCKVIAEAPKPADMFIPKAPRRRARIEEIQMNFQPIPIEVEV